MTRSIIKNRPFGPFRARRRHSDGRTQNKKGGSSCCLATLRDSGWWGGRCEVVGWWGVMYLSSQGEAEARSRHTLSLWCQESVQVETGLLLRPSIRMSSPSSEWTTSYERATSAESTASKLFFLGVSLSVVSATDSIKEPAMPKVTWWGPARRSARRPQGTGRSR